ncbi:MAG: S41 family peptidase [Bacteroidota bacterium]
MYINKHHHKNVQIVRIEGTGSHENFASKLNRTKIMIRNSFTILLVLFLGVNFSFGSIDNGKSNHISWEYYHKNQCQLNDNAVCLSQNTLNSDSLFAQKVENIEVLCQVWGFLKYYHPEVRKGKYNWDNELLKIMPNVINATTGEKRNGLLCNWIDSFGKVKSGKRKLNAIDSAIVVQWPDYSWFQDTVKFGTALIEKLSLIKDSKRTYKNYYGRMIFRGKLIKFGSHNFEREVGYESISYPDSLNIRLLGLFRYWNIIQYCYPYRYITDQQWNDVLRESIPAFYNSNDSDSYANALFLITAKTNDGHSSTRNKNGFSAFPFYYFAPYIISNIDESVVVFGKYSVKGEYAFQLKQGDVIRKINGIEIEKLVDERLRYVGGSHIQSTVGRASMALLTSMKDTTYHVAVLRENKVIELDVKSISFSQLDNNHFCKEEKKMFLRDSVVYFTPCTFRDYNRENFEKILSGCKSLIIDLRYYSANSWWMWQFISDKLLPQSKKYSGISHLNNKYPGMFIHKEYQKIGRKNKNYFKGNIVVIVDRTIMSSYEHLTLALQACPNTTVVGCHTAGANGDVMPFKLPGGFDSQISSVGIYYPDGYQLQRNGVKIDVAVYPTIEGLREGRDEQLEKAIEIAVSQKNTKM